MMLYQLPICISLILIFLSGNINAQIPCTALGQNPSTAFPVCGTSTFQQDSVPICSSNDLYVPGCSIPGDTATIYKNKNPFWYKFTCFQSGTLSVVIIPNLPDEDYDWQLYDITGHDPDDVYTDTTLIVTGNWSGTYDSTGASATGVNYIQCASDPSSLEPTFALSPNLIQGHNYLLLVSHFSDTEQGYSLSFGGGTAVITDTLPPHVLSLSYASCNTVEILVRLNKKMKCSSIAANGSDFFISPPGVLITSAAGTGCVTGFDTDSVRLTLNQPLPLGNYNLVVRNGTDGNTILDICDNGIPVSESISFNILSPLPVPMDSILTNHCITDSFELVFSSPIQCSSVATDGTDFYIFGNYPVSISSARPVNCVNGLTNRIIVYPSATMLEPGNFQLILQVGSDGNTLLSECDTPSIAGAAVPFEVLPKPVPGFGFPASVCLPDGTVAFTNFSTISNGTGNTLQYLWNFNDPASGANNISTLKTPSHRYLTIGPFNVNLRVTSNGGCIRDTTVLLNIIHPQPKTGFGISKPAICLGDAVIFTDSTDAKDGITVFWNWNLGDSTVINTQNPAHIYGAEKTYNVSLYSINSHGCYSDTLTKSITVHPYPAVDAGADRFVLEGGTVFMKIFVTGSNLQYLWTPSLYLNNARIANPRSMDIRNDITYTLTVTSTGDCTASDNVFIKVLKIPKVPNTFTPNNDGINDFWEIQYLEDYPNNHVQVFTRSGQLVFESRGYYKAWNGMYKGKSLAADTYYYILEPGSGRDPFTGFVTIIK